MLQTIIEAKQKQEYTDEATMKLAKIKAKKNARTLQETQPNSNDMKIEFKTENKDKDLFDQLYDAQKEKLKAEEKKDN